MSSHHTTEAPQILSKVDIQKAHHYLGTNQTWALVIYGTPDAEYCAMYRYIIPTEL